MNKKADGQKKFMFVHLFRNALLESRRHDPLKTAAATAFFTSFALPPILLILFQLFGLFMGKRLVGREMFESITDTFGQLGAQQIVQTARGFNSLAQNWYITIGGFVFLIFVATTLFTVIKNSFNQIWGVSTHKAKGLLSNLKARARSFAIILAAGILFVTGILIDSLELIAGKFMRELWSTAGAYFEGALNEIVGTVIVTAWFIVLFRYLADARPSWKVAIVGGVVTGVLYTLGKELLSLLMRNSNVVTIYGASGSIVLILLFVFYSSFILYFGAGFIKVYSEYIQQPIRLINNAYRYEIRVISEHQD